MSTSTSGPSTTTLTALRAAFYQAWQQRSVRERQLMLVAAWLVLASALWSLALAPALRTWQEAPSRQALLDATSSQMQQLQAQAQAFKKPSTVTRTEALRWLEDNIPTQLGAQTRWQLQGERLSVQLSGTSPEQLASFLMQARARAQALPAQAQLNQAHADNSGPRASGKKPSPSNPPGSPEANSHDVRWSGSLLLSLP